MPRLRRSAGAILASSIMVVALAACGQSASASGSTSASTAPKPVRIAVLVGATTNAYQAASLAAATAAAASAGGVEITSYDAGFDANKQVSQLEDVISLGTTQFDAILIFPVDNNLPVDGIRRAIQAGFKVGAADGALGPRLDTKEPQIEGLSVQVGPVWSAYGTRLGVLTTQACTGIDPCNVIFTKGLTNWAPEVEYRKTFAAEVAKSPNIKVVAEPGDTGYSRDGGLKVIGDAIQANPSASVIVGADQALLGAETALQDAGMFGKVKLVGLGGTKQAADRIASGSWFGTVGQAPADEGRIGVEALVAAVRSGKVTGGIDSQASLVNDAVITKAFVSQFTPQFEG